MLDDHEKSSITIAFLKNEKSSESIALKYDNSKLRGLPRYLPIDHFCLISIDRFLGKRIDNFGESLNRLVRAEALNTMTLRSMKR